MTYAQSCFGFENCFHALINCWVQRHLMNACRIGQARQTFVSHRPCFTSKQCAMWLKTREPEKPRFVFGEILNAFQPQRLLYIPVKEHWCTRDLSFVYLRKLSVTNATYSWKTRWPWISRWRFSVKTGEKRLVRCFTEFLSDQLKVVAGTFFFVFLLCIIRTNVN